MNHPSMEDLLQLAADCESLSSEKTLLSSILANVKSRYAALEDKSDEPMSDDELDGVAAARGIYEERIRKR